MIAHQHIRMNLPTGLYTRLLQAGEKQLSIRVLSENHLLVIAPTHHVIHRTRVLNPDLSLSTFDFSISSGKFQFKASGKVSEDSISVRTEASGSTRTFKVPVKEKPFLSSGILQALANHFQFILYREVRVCLVFIYLVKESR